MGLAEIRQRPAVKKCLTLSRVTHTFSVDRSRERAAAVRSRGILCVGHSFTGHSLLLASALSVDAAFSLFVWGRGVLMRKLSIVTLCVGVATTFHALSLMAQEPGDASRPANLPMPAAAEEAAPPSMLAEV